jgi:hypothetical protein
MNGAAAATVQRLRGLTCTEGLRGHIGRASGAAVILNVLNTLLGLTTTLVLAPALGPDGLGCSDLRWLS